MSTLATSRPTITAASNAERIGKAVAEVAKRIRIQEFDVVGMRGTTYGDAEKVTVSVHVDTRCDLNRAASYFQLRESKDIAGGVTVFTASPVVGLGGALVEVFGPTADDEDRA
jgi:hypothetical protein